MTLKEQAEKLREKQRIQMARIKADPVRYEEYLRKQRERDEQRKAIRKANDVRARHLIGRSPEAIEAELRGEVSFSKYAEDSTVVEKMEANRKMCYKADLRAKRDRKEKWRGMHRYDALMAFIAEGMPDEEIIRRIGIYKEKSMGEVSNRPDYKLLEVFKRVARGEISKGHSGMEWAEMMKSLKEE